MADSATPTIAIVLKGYPRVSESFISNEIRFLEQKGFRIHIFSMRRPRENFSHASVKDIQARVTYLPSSLISSLPSFFMPNLRTLRHHRSSYIGQLKVALSRLLIRRSTSRIKHLLQAGYLVDWIVRNPSIIHLHAHFAHSPTRVAMIASRICGKPFSFTAHAKDVYLSPVDALREKIRAALFVITCTEYNRNYLRSLVGNQSQISSVYHGIDLSLFSGKEMRKNPTSPYLIMTVARLVEKKGLPTVLRALAILRDRNVAFDYVLIGSGEEEDILRSLLAELKLTSCTRLTGTLPHEQVLNFYRRADLFVIGSQIAVNGDRDGIPNVLVESMAMGVPVVATSVSGIPELIADGETGLLVPPEHPEYLARAMHQLLEDCELREKVIAAARERVKEGFDAFRLIDDIARVYADHGIIWR